MLSKVRRFLSPKNISITARITLWYAIFILSLVGAAIASALFVADEILENADRNELVESVGKMTNSRHKFEAFDDGIFFIKYDGNGKIIDGLAPKNFDVSLKLIGNKIQTYQNEYAEFIYYDAPAKNGVWIRGIVNNSKFRGASRFLLAFGVLLPIFFSLVLYGGYKMLKSAFKPVAVMSNAALEIGSSKDFSKRIDMPSGKDELHKLASVFNSMLDSLEKVYKNEKELTLNVSHELRTPVSIVLAESDYALQYSQNLDDAKESLEVINRQSKKIALLIDRILELARLENGQNIVLKEINLSEILSVTTSDYKKLAKEKSINLTSQIEPDIKILGDEIMITRLINNLLNNALKFTKTKVEIRLLSRKNNAILEVADDGAGISKSERELVWNKFYQSGKSRNKELNDGNGLGLAMVANIAEIHGANYEISGQTGVGSEFIIKFPLYKA